jgi:hypothetical protein
MTAIGCESCLFKKRGLEDGEDIISGEGIVQILKNETVIGTIDCKDGHSVTPEEYEEGCDDYLQSFGSRIDDFLIKIGWG